MSLRVWLPLIKDYKNQGLSDLTFSPFSSTASIQPVGRIGAGSFYNSSYSGGGGLISNKRINLGNKITMCCWVKPNAFYADAELAGGMGGQHRYSTCTGMGLTFKYLSSTTAQLSVNTGDGAGGRTYNTYRGNTTLTVGRWYHVAFTYDGTTIKFYVNGKFDGSHTYTAQSNINDYVGVGVWSFDGNSERANYHHYMLHGNMNDFRIYDHVLSNREIKEISKGLALHYQLRSSGMLNYLRGSEKYLKDTPLIRKVSDTGQPNDSYIYYDTSDLCAVIPAEGTYTWVVEADGTPCSHPTGGSNGSARQFSMWLQNTSTGNHYLWSNYGTGPDGRHYGSITIPAGTYKVRTNLYASDNVNYTLKIWDMKLVQGNYSPDDVWIPYRDAEMYSKFNMGFDAETDYSGFQNDAEKNSSFAVASGSPRYGRAYDFDGHYKMTNTTLDTTGWTDMTVAAWVYPTKLNNGQDRSCVVIGGVYLTIEPDGKIGTYCYGKSKEGYHSTSAKIPASQWSHIAGVWDDVTATHKIYINGEVALTVTGCSGAASNNGQHVRKQIGIENTGDRPYHGKMSDVRIYGSALSDEDVRELYNTGAFVCKNGTFAAYDFHENKQNNVDKTGIASSSGFSNQIVPTYDMKLTALGDRSTWARIHYLDLTNDTQCFTSAAEVMKCTNKHNRYSRLKDIPKYKVGTTWEFMLTYPQLKKTLPEGYTELEYIQATGAQYIKTGVFGYSDGTYIRGHRWEFDIEFETNGQRQLMGYGPYGGEYWGMAADGTYEGLPKKAGKRDLVVHDYSGGTAGGNLLWVDYNARSVGSNLETSYEYTLFNLYWGGNTGYFCHSKLYRCKCVQGTTLIRDFVPAMRNSDNVIGLYDLVNGVFYTNAGSGNFYCNYSWLNYIQSTGTQWINTGVPVASNTWVETDLMFDAAFDYNMMFGTWTDSFAVSLKNGNALCVGVGAATTQNLGVAATTKTKYNIILGPNSGYTQDGVTTPLGGATNATTGRSILLFGASASANDTPHQWNTYGVGKIYSFKIYTGTTGDREGSTLVRDFIPCINNGVVGMLDKVTGGFYTNSGSGNFIPGYKSGEYKWLDYVKSSGTQYIDTGVIPDNNTRIVIKANLIGNVSIYGTSESGKNFNMTGGGDKCYYYWNGGGASPQWSYLNQIHTYEQDKNVCKIDGSTVHTYTNTTWAATTSILLFARNHNVNGPNDMGEVRIYSCQIYNNGTLVRDFVPCVSPLGKVGMYDKVTKRFFGNSGTGNFIAGTTKESVPLYNRWIQNAFHDDVATGDSIGFMPITTTWPAHCGPLKAANSGDTKYDCDVVGTSNWYAPIGQYNIWSGGIPAADGNPTLQTELWIRVDRPAQETQFNIYDSCMTATDYIEI